MEDKKIQVNAAINDDELETVVGGADDEKFFREVVRIACNSCNHSFQYLLICGETTVSANCPICGAKIFFELF